MTSLIISLTALVFVLFLATIVYDDLQARKEWQRQELAKFNARQAMLKSESLEREMKRWSRP